MTKDFNNEVYILAISILSKFNVKVVYKCFKKLETFDDQRIIEAAHAQANREGKQLKLITAILRGKKLDERLFKIKEIHNKSGVPYTRRDKSEIKRKAIAIIRKSTRKRNHKEVLKEESKKISDKKGVKRKAVIDSSKVKKTRININEPDNEQENNLCSEIDIEER
ncbi:7428_t:CDS:2 [Funneliformis caledonium]|uniref:7428_t:CDS:1 n=1 Tax=Funneliformis caledonium TaxID=1117310 RepID=A0A9N9BPT9_9GLOM|nr:7428_t:CDS:2 [Funneliformis caledonium]